MTEDTVQIETTQHAPQLGMSGYAVFLQLVRGLLVLAVAIACFVANFLGRGQPTDIDKVRVVMREDTPSAFRSGPSSIPWSEFEASAGYGKPTPLRLAEPSDTWKHGWPVTYLYRDQVTFHDYSQTWPPNITCELRQNDRLLSFRPAEWNSHLIRGFSLGSLLLDVALCLFVCLSTYRTTGHSVRSLRARNTEGVSLQYDLATLLALPLLLAIFFSLKQLSEFSLLGEYPTPSRGPVSWLVWPLEIFLCLGLLCTMRMVYVDVHHFIQHTLAGRPQS